MANILLIEPDRLLAQIYYEALIGDSNNVFVASGAQTAVIAADKQLPELIILELQLVEHSGIEFLYELRSYPEWQTIPVILNTNVPPSEFNDTSGILREELGVAHYLYKPATSLDKLLSVVRERSAVEV